MSDDLNAAIEAVVRERLAEANVQNVVVTEDQDVDGDRIYRVLVIYDGQTGKLDAHRTSGLARHLRSKLERYEAFTHPVFRFVSHADAKKLKPEAA